MLSKTIFMHNIQSDMTYAVVEIGGKQIYVQPGKFYDVNKLQVSPGETVLLNKILLLRKKDNLILGYPCIHSHNIKAKVLRHLKGSKIVVLKMKSKKNMRSKKGFRQHLTRLLIQEI